MAVDSTKIEFCQHGKRNQVRFPANDNIAPTKCTAQVRDLWSEKYAYTISPYGRATVPVLSGLLHLSSCGLPSRNFTSGPPLRHVKRRDNQKC